MDVVAAHDPVLTGRLFRLITDLEVRYDRQRTGDTRSRIRVHPIPILAIVERDVAIDSRDPHDPLGIAEAAGPQRDAAAARAIVAALPRTQRTLLITDGVFSMDGDLGPLPALCELAEETGCIMMVDDAHASGVFGSNGRGTIDHFGMHGRVDVQVGTLSKAIGVLGGFIAYGLTSGTFDPVLALTSAPLAWDGAQLRCECRSAAGSLFSSNATLRVIPDTTAPRLISAPLSQWPPRPTGSSRQAATRWRSVPRSGSPPPTSS